MANGSQYRTREGNCPEHESRENRKKAEAETKSHQHSNFFQATDEEEQEGKDLMDEIGYV